MNFKPFNYKRFPMSPARSKRRTKEEIIAQNKANNDLCAEYKTASPKRRGQIFQEYYEGNISWTNYWSRWSREHWEELTQIYVSYWHEAFMRYTPKSEASVFNFYMNLVYKSKASRAYEDWLEKDRNMELTYSMRDNGKDLDRKETFIHPQSEWDREILRDKLCRKLDTQEANIVSGYFFGDRDLSEIRKKDTDLSETGFYKRYQKMLNKLIVNVTREELYEIASQKVDKHPLAFIAKKQKEHRRRVGGERVKMEITV